MKSLLVACAAFALTLPGPARADGLKAVVFAIEPVEMPKTPEIKARLDAATGLLRKQMADRGFTVVATEPQAKRIADNLPLSQCNGCDQDIAKALGADVEVTTAVQQSSSAIFNLSGSIKDVRTNRVLREGVVDIRGSAEDVWNHGVKFLLRERLLEPPLPKDEAALKTMVDAAPKPAE